MTDVGKPCPGAGLWAFNLEPVVPPSPGRRPKGHCIWCGKIVALNDDFRVYPHKFTGYHHDWKDPDFRDRYQRLGSKIAGGVEFIDYGHLEWQVIKDVDRITWTATSEEYRDAVQYFVETDREGRRDLYVMVNPGLLPIDTGRFELPSNHKVYLFESFDDVGEALDYLLDLDLYLSTPEGFAELAEWKQEVV